MDKATRSSPVFSGGLEETYTDFDGWLTRRHWLHRHRPYQRSSQDIQPSRKGNTMFDVQDSLTNGLCSRKMVFSGCPTKDLSGLTRFGGHEDGTQLDLILIRLMKENGKRRLLLVNRSKL